MVKSGKLVYLSAFLFRQQTAPQQLRLHGGTVFDYYFSLDLEQPARIRRKAVITGILQGLQQLAESPDDDTTRIRLTSYILNERTARAAGLQPAAREPLQMLLIILNWPALVLAQYMAGAETRFPAPSAIRTFGGTLGDLRKQQQTLAQLTHYLEKKPA